MTHLSSTTWPYRPRLLEYFRIVLEWERDHGVLSLNELVNDWEMVMDHPVSREELRSLRIAEEVIEALVAVDVTWLAFANATPNPIHDEAGALSIPEWRAFQRACAQARLVIE